MSRGKASGGSSAGGLFIEMAVQVVSRTTSSGERTMLLPTGRLRKMSCRVLAMTVEMFSIWVSMVVSWLCFRSG